MGCYIVRITVWVGFPGPVLHTFPLGKYWPSLRHPFFVGACLKNEKLDQIQTPSWCNQRWSWRPSSSRASAWLGLRFLACTWTASDWPCHRPLLVSCHSRWASQASSVHELFFPFFSQEGSIHACLPVPLLL